MHNTVEESVGPPASSLHGPPTIQSPRNGHDEPWVDRLPRALPIERRGRADRPFVAARVPLVIPYRHFGALQTAAGRTAGSASTWLLAAWQLLIWNLLDRSPFATGVNIAPTGGLNPGDAPYLPVICEPDPAMTVQTFVTQLQSRLDTHAGWRSSFCWPADGPTDLRAFPLLFEAVAHEQFADADRLVCQVPGSGESRNDYRLRCACTITPRDVHVILHYDAAAIDERDVSALARQFRSLCARVVQALGATIGSLGVVDRRVDPQRAGPRANPRSVLDGFLARAADTPHQIAVVAPDGVRSFHELLADASAISQRLEQLGVGLDEVVGVVAEPSIRTIAALLGIWFAGGAYAPLDVEMPPAYREKQLAASRIRLLLGSGSLTRSRSAAYEIVDVDRLLDAADARPVAAPIGIADASLAYVIHTSGSTGVPKGVGVSHGALANYTAAICERLGWIDGSALHFAVASSLAADLGHTCLFPALVTGGTLHLLPKRTSIDGRSFADYITANGVDVLKIVPSHLRALLEHGKGVLPRRWLISGGEPFTADLHDALRAAGASCAIVNHYGPTETTVGCLVHDVVGDEPVTMPAILPVGAPLADTEAWVLDERMRPVGVNMPGELFIGGAGVARGYLYQPDRTAERFVPHPWSATPGGRLYRTGDRARRRRNGRIQILGRTDDQVKIRGHRLELSEVEAILGEQSGVAGAAVIVNVHGGDTARLTAYLVRSRDVHAADDEIRSAVARQLPPAMIPAELVWVERLPLLSNGKIDRKQLAQPPAARLPPVPSHGSSVATAIADMWKQVLGRDHVGPQDNFFALGGDSISAIQVAALFQKAGLRIMPIELFQYPTLSDLAAIASAAETVDAPSPGAPATVAPAVEQFPLTAIQQGLLFHCLSAPGERLYVSELVLTFDPAFEPDAFLHAWQRVVDRQSMFRTAFRWEDHGEPVQVVLPHVSLVVDRLDWSSVPPTAVADTRARYCDAIHRTGLDLRVAPIMHVALARLPDGRHEFIWIYHHLLMDGWSESILFNELKTYYHAFRAGRDPERPLPAPYREYVEWTQRQDAERGAGFWRDYLRGFRSPTAVALDADDAPGEAEPPRWEKAQVALSAAEGDALRDVAQRQHITLNTIVQGAWALALSDHSGDTDVVFGATMAVRPPDMPRLGSTIGLFLNTLPVRARLRRDEPAAAWLRELQAGQVRAREYGATSLVQVQAYSDVPRGRPLFETFIGFQNLTLLGSQEPASAPPLPIERACFRGGWTNYALSVDVEPHREILLTVSCNLCRLPAQAGHRLLMTLHSALSVIAANPTATVGTLVDALAARRRNDLARESRLLLERQRAQFTRARHLA